MPLTNAALPPGIVFTYGGTTAPTGYLLCNGTAVSRTTYAALFTAIGVAHGNGDGSTTFNLPDYRGRFIRGYDAGQGRDPDAAGRTAMASGGNTGDNIGSVQGHSFQTHTHIQNSHTHPISNADSNNRLIDSNTAGGIGNSNTGAPTYTTVDPASFLTAASQTPTNQNAVASGTHSQASSNESRPVNVNANYIIKY